MKSLTIASKLGHYEAVLTSTLEGVKVEFWFRYQDGQGMRQRLSTDVIDAPFHFVANKVHDSIWSMVPEIVTQRSN